MTFRNTYSDVTANAATMVDAFKTGAAFATDTVISGGIVLSYRRSALDKFLTGNS